MCKRTAKFTTCFFIVFLLFFIVNSYDVKAYKKYNEIYNFEKDGYWKPTDDIVHDFYIENIWNEGCYLEGIGFQRVSISDIQSNKIYETNEAISSGIMDNKYYVTISKGDKLCYSGKMSQLMKQEYITLDEPIFLEVDTKIKFSMEIYFDALAGNEYQNKKYEYVVYPKVFKIKEEFKPEINLPQTGSIISSNLIIVLSILLIVFGINIKVAKGRNINEK